MRLIDADAILNTFCDNCPNRAYCEDREQKCSAYSDTEEILKSAPTVESEPQKENANAIAARTEPRYIDAEALKKDLTRFYDSEVTARALIDEQPTADVQPVKHGRWIFIRYDTDGRKTYKCSECGSTLSVIPEMELAMSRENFCYNCGARMDGDSE